MHLFLPSTDREVMLQVAAVLVIFGLAWKPLRARSLLPLWTGMLLVVAGLIALRAAH